MHPQGFHETLRRGDDAVKGEGRTIIFISGPSATSDFEHERVEGVHCPRTFEVLIVG
jgi:L-lactate utilization protein LutC